MRAVIVNTNTNLVVNHIELEPESDYAPGTNLIKIFNDAAQIGWSWNGSVFTAPTEPPAPIVVPFQITALQFLLQAAADGIITQLEALNAAKTGAVPAVIQEVFDSLSPVESFAAAVKWARMTTVLRDDPLVSAVAAQLNMTSEDVDEFFISANIL